MLPAPPDDLPAAPRAFYEAVREAAERMGPLRVDRDGMEVDFGDSGVGLTLPHAEGDLVVGAQVSLRAAVVFAGPVAEHFDDRDPEWTAKAAACVAEALSEFLNA